MSATTITPTRVEQLSSEEWAQWDTLQTSVRDLSSPYFRPEYTQLVAEVRPNVEVAVIRSGDAAIGFFPYERKRFNIAGPVGAPMTDYQGVIATPDVPITSEQLLRACGLSGYHFNHLAPGQNCFSRGVRSEHDSPCLDVRGGLKSYLERANSKRIDGWLRKRRKLDREVGPLRLVLDCREDAVFEALLAWKSAQYRRTEAPDVFRHEWTRNLLHRCWQQQTDRFSGWLTALYAGDKLVAAHFCLRSSTILHSWFPAYDVELKQHSPGIVLDLELIDAADAAGIACIDLGKGQSDYKQALMTGSVRVGEGAVSLGWVSHLLHDAWPQTRERIRSSGLKRPVQWLGRTTRSLRGYLAFR